MLALPLLVGKWKQIQEKFWVENNIRAIPHVSHSLSCFKVQRFETPQRAIAIWRLQIFPPQINCQSQIIQCFSVRSKFSKSLYLLTPAIIVGMCWVFSLPSDHLEAAGYCQQWKFSPVIFSMRTSMTFSFVRHSGSRRGAFRFQGTGICSPPSPLGTCIPWRRTPES